MSWFCLSTGWHKRTVGPYSGTHKILVNYGEVKKTYLIFKAVADFERRFERHCRSIRRYFGQKSRFERQLERHRRSFCRFFEPKRHFERQIQRRSRSIRRYFGQKSRFERQIQRHCRSFRRFYTRARKDVIKNSL